MPGRQTINKLHPAVTTSTNTANVLTEIMRVTVPDRCEYLLRDGTPIAMKLKSSGGTEILNTSVILVAALSPGKTLPEEIDKFSYDAFKQLTLAEQLDVTKQTRLRIRVAGGGMRFPEKYVLVIYVQADQVVSFTTQSDIVFEMEDRRIGY